MTPRRNMRRGKEPKIPGPVESADGRAPKPPAPRSPSGSLAESAVGGVSWGLGLIGGCLRSEEEAGWPETW
jgi:hypothetical protein